MKLHSSSIDNRESIEWILIAKGIGVILVVTGHFRPDTSPYYWHKIVNIIYLFHMPLFFILSGYLYTYDKYPYIELIKKKMNRLLYPFISIAFLFFFIKFYTGKILALEHPVDILSIYTIITDPVNSYMPLLWFIHTLFIIFAIYPFIITFISNIFIGNVFIGNVFMLIFILIINVIFKNDYLIFEKAFCYIPFFITGLILRDINVYLMIDYKRSRFFAQLSLLPLLYLFQVSYFNHFFMGIIGSLAIICISHFMTTISVKNVKEIFVSVGYYSMSIYLFHTLFESMVRLLFFQVIKIDKIPFLFIAFFAITCGVIFPLMCEKKIFRRFFLTRRLLLGIS
jgi:fucose 4-O-acetylase-like acetyltransferase